MKNENQGNRVSNLQMLGTPQPRKSKIVPNLAEQVNKEYANRPDKPIKQQSQTQPQIQKNIQNLDGMIYVPSIDLHFSKKRIYEGEDWYDCHKLLQKEGTRMPIIPEFIEFLKHLKNNPNQENTEIYKDITEVRSPWRAEWLDADFKVKKRKLHINYNHVLDSQGNLQPQNSEKLEACLMENCYADILNPNKQGLPTEKSDNQEFYFWAPMKDNNSVARFVAISDGAYLNCDRGPTNSNASLGVRQVAKALSSA